MPAIPLPRRCVFPACCLLIVLHAACRTSPVLADARSIGVVFPPDAGVVDVTGAPYEAVPDDGRDDTAAIQAALDAHPSGNHIFYFPDGTYDLSATLRPALDDGVTKRNIFQGQSERRTILRLRDDLDHAGAVIDFRAGPAQFFRNAVRNLTLDIGRGNPNASGLQFNASNQGTIHRVTLRSRDRGLVGLDLQHSDEIGPLLIRHLTVDGFTKGIVTRFQTASQTLEHITLRNQSEVGWWNTSTQTVFARRVQSTNQVTAITNDGEGRMLLVDSSLRGHGRAATEPAIRNQKAMYLRDVDTCGYSVGVTNQLVARRGNHAIAAGPIDEYWANGAYDGRRGGTFELFESPDTTLRLPIQEIPELAWDDLDAWAGPHQYGGAANDRRDDTAALQAAIDSGATTIYLPRGTWQIQGTVRLGGAVRRLLGTEAHVTGGGRIRVVDGESDTVMIERLQGGSITYEHASQRTLVLQHLLGFRYEPGIDSPGDLFLSDVVGHTLAIRKQDVWARQLNLEGDIERDASVDAKIVNDGGRLWILGLKTEDDGTHIKTLGGGRTELLGALHVGGFGAAPRFVTEEASLTAAIVKGGPGSVVEIRGGETRQGSFGNADVYSAFPTETIRFREILVDNDDATGFQATGKWTKAAGYPGGFIDRDFLFAEAGPGKAAVFSAQLPQAGRYSVAVRWLDDRSGQAHSGHAPDGRLEVHHAEGMAPHILDQRDGGGRWVTLGTYPFHPQQSAVVRFDAENASGKVIVDAVRFRAGTNKDL